MDIVMKRDDRTGQERPQERDLQDRPRVVRVVPKNDAVRRYLKHGLTKVGFLAEGSAEWPLDQFTKRRIKDGDVTIEEGAAQAEEGTDSPIQSSGAKSPAGKADKSPPPGDTSGAVDPSKTTAPAPGTPGRTAP
jgi:hypothetical protein